VRCLCRRVLSARELATVRFRSGLGGVVEVGVVCGDEITGGVNLTGRTMGFENPARNLKVLKKRLGGRRAR